MIRALLTPLGYFIGLIGLIVSNAATAVEPTQGMTITGDQELPQVLYIIPWKEQQPAMPVAPKTDDPILQPLSPCDTGQAMSDYQTELWRCLPTPAAAKP
tara:strand:+ start:9634 stop:9933 length:300 start_codon:yes stop_codon:yes gene_type:complete